MKPTKGCFALRKLCYFLCLGGMVGLSTNAMASAFQLWEQDAASVGNYHAGRAAIAEDASTGYYNPAGLVRIQNQQLIVGLVPIFVDTRFRGTVAVNTLGTGPRPVTAQGGTFNLVPDAHYSAPLTKNLILGLSVVSPFGLRTNYGTSSIVRYVSTLASIKVIDYTPSLGFAFNNKISAGVGFDAEHLNGEFDFVGTFVNPILDTRAYNIGTSTAYGYHLGGLYQVSEQTRVGLSYHSKIIHHLTGKSRFVGPLANNLAGGVQASSQLRVNLTLPATTSLSVFHTLNPVWDVMGSLIYTQWDVTKNLVFQNTAGISGGRSSNTITAIIPQNYRNTWNASVGADYHINTQWTLRSGLGFDESPANDRARNVELPDANRVAVAVGGHYQANKALGFDLGWTHLFSMNTRINNLSQALGDQVTITNGSDRTNADILGLQVRWDIV
jgi:long-chain fatty acid transport protein